jgi:hypothetical protein
MAKYNVAIPWYATVNIEVEADTPEEAEEKACREVHASVCHYCSKHIEIGEQDYERSCDVQEIP